MARAGAHIEDAQTLDAALATHRLTDPTIGRATAALRKLGPDGPTIVAEHTIDITPPAWARLGPDLCRHIPSTGSISRADLYAAAHGARADGNWLPVFVATFAWGQGRNGYGAYRTEQILAGSPDAAERLATAVRVLDADGPVAAYQAMLRGSAYLPELGPAFFTKFLHAVAPDRALILDKVVATQMRPFAAQAAAQAGSVTTRPVDRVASRLFSNSGWSAHRYRVYLDWARQALTQLHAADPVWGDDIAVVEFALFRGLLTVHPTDTSR